MSKYNSRMIQVVGAVNGIPGVSAPMELSQLRKENWHFNKIRRLRQFYIQVVYDVWFIYLIGIQRNYA